MGPAAIADSGDTFILGEDESEIRMSKATGLVDSYMFKGIQLLEQGGGIRPNFWRAVTDNDFGAGQQLRFKEWHSPEMTLESIEADSTVKAVLRY